MAGRRWRASGPTLRPRRTAEAAAPLWAHALNTRAHPADGLDGAIALIARRARFARLTADLPAPCAVVHTLRRGRRHG